MISKSVLFVSLVGVSIIHGSSVSAASITSTPGSFTPTKTNFEWTFTWDLTFDNLTVNAGNATQWKVLAVAIPASPPLVPKNVLFVQGQHVIKGDPLDDKNTGEEIFFELIDPLNITSPNFLADTGNNQFKPVTGFADFRNRSHTPHFDVYKLRYNGCWG